jgi:hypothetical protein
MAMGRVVLFQQSRWDARTSVDRQVAFEGGYSTRDAWLLRARADMPHLADGWRLQAIAETAHLAEYLLPGSGASRADRQIVSGDLSRRLGRHTWLALRGDAMHVNIPLDSSSASVSETDIRGRLALIYDGRNREYQPQSGLLMQGGVLGGSAGTGYAGFYLMFGGWAPIGASTRASVHEAFRSFEETTIDAARIIPGWEDEITVGGTESNRTTPIGAGASRDVSVGSVQIEHDLKVFPGGAFSVLLFADGTHTGGGDNTLAQGSPSVQPAVTSTNFATGWIVGAGGGVSLRLLRNAILTATVGRADGATRVYVGGGWGW